MKSITQAHEDALSKARPECHFATHADKAVQAYLKSMMDDGYIITQQAPPVTAEEVGVLTSYGSDC